MSQELQHLIDRIQSEAVDEAREKGNHILAQARVQAAQELKDAEAKAEALVAEAEKEAKVFTEHSQKTLEQAGRDLLISVGQGIESIMENLASSAVTEAMDMDTLKACLVKVVEAYVANRGRDGRIRVLLNEQDQEALQHFFNERFQSAMAQGLEVVVDEETANGFRISYEEEKAFHDFTHLAMTRALSEFLQPHLSEIVHKAAAAKEAE